MRVFAGDVQTHCRSAGGIEEKRRPGSDAAVPEVGHLLFPDRQRKPPRPFVRDREHPGLHGGREAEHRTSPDKLIKNLQFNIIRPL